MKTPSGTYFEVSELKRRVFVVVGPNFVSQSLNGGGGLKFNPKPNQPLTDSYTHMFTHTQRANHGAIGRYDIRLISNIKEY